MLYQRRINVVVFAGQWCVKYVKEFFIRINKQLHKKLDKQAYVNCWQDNVKLMTCNILII